LTCHISAEIDANKAQNFAKYAQADTGYSENNTASIISLAMQGGIQTIV
jgi:hypothetical protein